MASYEIILRNKTSDAGSSSSAASPRGNTKKTVPDTAPPPIRQLAGMGAAYGIAKSAMSKIVTHTINTVSLRTGQTEYQQRLQFQYEIASRGFNILESVVVGAMVGNAPGAILGAATSLGSALHDLYNRSDTLRISRNLENISIGLADIRAGARADRQGRDIS